MLKTLPLALRSNCGGTEDRHLACFRCAFDQNLTSSWITRMVFNVCRKILVALLILGWISLSGFDLIEDLDEIPGQVAVSSASPLDSSTSKRGGWGPLANNIVESAANLTQQADVTLISFIPTI